MAVTLRSLARAAAVFFAADTQQEREKRSAHAVALLLVAAVAIVKAVTGLTVHDAPFTLYALAVALAAARGGVEPGLVATLASLLAASIAGAPLGGTYPRAVFAVEGLSVALVVSALRAQALASDAARRGAEATVDQVRHVGYLQAAEEAERHREWDEYREAAARADAALREAADETRRQLAALEGLTDPELNPLGGPAMVTELLERLRVNVRADGTALVMPGRSGQLLAAVNGLQPGDGPFRPDRANLGPGRVAMVHNDPARVAQLSGARWPPTMASLLVVPVVYDGAVCSTIEVVTERPRQVGEWDVALARIVADRLAAVVVDGGGRAAPAA